MHHECLARSDARAVTAHLPAGAPAVDVADYIADLTSELAHVAQRANLPVLSYLLELANGEARAMVLLGRDRAAAA